VSWVVVLDVVLCLLALVVLGVLALRLWRRVTALGREVGLASDTFGLASQALAGAQASGPLAERTGRNATPDGGFAAGYAAGLAAAKVRARR